MLFSSKTKLIKNNKQKRQQVIMFFNAMTSIKL